MFKNQMKPGETMLSLLKQSGKSVFRFTITLWLQFLKLCWISSYPEKAFFMKWLHTPN